MTLDEVLATYPADADPGRWVECRQCGEAIPCSTRTHEPYPHRCDQHGDH